MLCETRENYMPVFFLNSQKADTRQFRPSSVTDFEMFVYVLQNCQCSDKRAVSVCLLPSNERCESARNKIIHHAQSSLSWGFVVGNGRRIINAVYMLPTQ